MIFSGSYKAPFDIALEKLRASKIKECRTDGLNKIIILTLEQQNSYKKQLFSLHFELTNKHTNAILLDSENRVIEALRFLNSSQSYREVLKNSLLIPLDQPKIPPKSAQDLQNTELFDEQKITSNLISDLKQAYEISLQNSLKQKKESAINYLNKKSENLKALKNGLTSAQDLIENAKVLREIAQNLELNREHFKPYKIEQIFGAMTQSFININEAINWHYNRAKKLEQKAAGINIQLQNIEEKLAFLTHQIAFVQATKSLSDLNIFKVQNLKKQDLGKFVTFFIENYKFSVGRNWKENKDLVSLAKGNDIWLHARDIPASHGIIHCGKTTPSIEVITKCAEILASFTTFHKVWVDYTLRKFVKLRADANVIYSKQKTLHFVKEPACQSPQLET